MLYKIGGLMLCENCGKELTEMYRFTDWYDDSNDEYGTYEECLAIFNNVVKENPEGRYSIYDVSECSHCNFMKDEGILYNPNCSDLDE
jgi:hypothetical protein